MSNRQPTIKDVAKLSGVSIGTVDRVLHQRGRVSEKNKQAVLEAVEALSYQPSQIARALAARRNNFKIGLTYPNVEHDFWAECRTGIELAISHLKPFGVEVVVDQTLSYDINEQIQSIDRLVEQGINALLLTPVSDSFPDKLARHIPGDIAYGTVIDDTVSSGKLFHVGPDDFSMGALAAKLVDLYTLGRGNVVVLSPNVHFSGTQKRISGFMSKVKQEPLNLNILQVCPVPGETEEYSYESIQQVTHDCIKNHSALNAIYVTNGLTEWAASAVESAGKSGEVLVFGHEYTAGLPGFLNRGTVGATIYQKPAQEWHTAVNLMYEYLVGEQKITAPVFHTECTIITKESLPLISLR